MALWYYHCRGCGHHFKLSKATKFSLDKVKATLHCDRCGKTNIEPSMKEAYDRERKTGKTNYV